MGAKGLSPRCSEIVLGSNQVFSRTITCKGKRLEDGKVVPLDVQVGDRILFGKYTSSEIKIDGEELLIMREDEILGIITRAGTAAGGKKK